MIFIRFNNNQRIAFTCEFRNDDPSLLPFFSFVCYKIILIEMTRKTLAKNNKAQEINWNWADKCAKMAWMPRTDIIAQKINRIYLYHVIIIIIPKFDKYTWTPCEKQNEHGNVCMQTGWRNYKLSTLWITSRTDLWIHISLITVHVIV